jgi:hypothetical protein
MHEKGRPSHITGAHDSSLFSQARPGLIRISFRAAAGG